MESQWNTGNASNLMGLYTGGGGAYTGSYTWNTGNVINLMGLYNTELYTGGAYTWNTGNVSNLMSLYTGGGGLIVGGLR